MYTYIYMYIRRSLLMCGNHKPPEPQTTRDTFTLLAKVATFTVVYSCEEAMARTEQGSVRVTTSTHGVDAALGSQGVLTD